MSDDGIGAKLADETGAAMVASAREHAQVAAQLAARQLFERAGNPAELGRTELEWAATIALACERAFITGFVQGVNAGSRDTRQILHDAIDMATSARRAARH